MFESSKDKLERVAFQYSAVLFCIVPGVLRDDQVEFAVDEDFPYTPQVKLELGATAVTLNKTELPLIEEEAVGVVNDTVKFAPDTKTKDIKVTTKKSKLRFNLFISICFYISSPFGFQEIFNPKAFPLSMS